MNIPNHYKDLLAKFPFLTVAHCSGEYLGIIQNQDNQIVSMYLYENLRSDDHKKLFLELGSEWYWETNRKIPINIVIGERFSKFRYCLATFNMKDFEIIHGETVCLKDIMQKRVKRRNVQLIRKVD
jgi:hypothetical protein